MRVVEVLAGAVVVAGTILSAVRTVVVPRALQTTLTRVVFLAVRRVLMLRMWLFRARTFRQRDRVLALYAPTALLALPALWLVLIMGGYMLMFRGLEDASWRTAFSVSGSSVVTLGFATLPSVGAKALSVTEAALGIGALALLITYLPTLYGAFSRREMAVALLEVRADSPPSAVAMIRRYHLIHGLDRLVEVWRRWEEWFADIEETHTSYPVLVFFRSPNEERSWITAAGAVLDAASFAASSLDGPRRPEAELCVRAGYVALRAIADFFDIPYEPDPAPTDPISVRREEFEQVWAELERLGTPLRPDREQAWRDFQGWRVNYDAVLLGLAALVVPPSAPWSSDRAPAYRRPRLVHRRP